MTEKEIMTSGETVAVLTVAIRGRETLTLSSLVIDGVIRLLMKLSEYEARDGETERLRAVLKEYREAEWMVTHDWGGDRAALLAKVDSELPGETPPNVGEHK